MTQENDRATIYEGKRMIITTVKIQKRKHHKHRINKKWAKRYGFITQERQPKGQIIVYEDTIYITEKDYHLIVDAAKQRYG